LIEDKLSIDDSVTFNNLQDEKRRHETVRLFSFELIVGSLYNPRIIRTSESLLA
jgi:hypothetical protein